MASPVSQCESVCSLHETECSSTTVADDQRRGTVSWKDDRGFKLTEDIYPSDEDDVEFGCRSDEEDDEDDEDERDSLDSVVSGSDSEAENACDDDDADNDEDD